MTTPGRPTLDSGEQADAPAARPPSRTDPTAWRAARAIGGAWGRHAGTSPRSRLRPVAWLLIMTTVTLLLGFAEKSPCVSGQWTGSKQYTHACYTDIVPLWTSERLNENTVPYRDTKIEYPVLTGGFMWLTADLTRGLHAVGVTASEQTIFVVLTCILLAVCGLVVTVATAGAAGRRPYDVAIFALSPLLIFHAFTNWDLLAMAFTAGALWAWAKDKPVLAGALIGLGTAAKLYPGLLLIPILLLALRTARWRDPLWCAAAAAGTWLAVNLPIALAYSGGWWEFYRFSADRPTERSTLWAILRTMTTASLGDNDAPYWVPSGAWVAVALIVAVVAIGFIALRAPVRPRMGQLAFLVVLAFLLTTKVWSPQYSLWLVPLLALARPRWRLNLIWQFTEILVWVLTLTLLINYSTPQHGIAYGWLVLVLLVRDGLLLTLAALMVREMWQPWLDVVRVDGTDDPAGGIFDGTPDAFVLRSPDVHGTPGVSHR